MKGAKVDAALEREVHRKSNGLPTSVPVQFCPIFWLQNSSCNFFRTGIDDNLQRAKIRTKTGLMNGCDKLSNPGILSPNGGLFMR